MSIGQRHWAATAILVVLGALLYSYTLPYPFVFDDFIYLDGNPLVKTAASFGYPFHFKSFATMPTRLGLDPDLAVNFILRPVTYFSFYLNFAIDGMNPRGFRAVNIAIHCANALLIYSVLTHLLYARNFPRRSAISPGFIPFFASLLFLVHPLQVESVTYVVQRFTSLATLFYLFTVLAHFRSVDSSSKCRSRGLRWSAMAFLVAGLLSKEDVFTAPFMLVIIDCLVIGTPFKAACKRALPFFLLLPIVPALILLATWASRGEGLSGALNIANSTDLPVNQYHYLLTQLSVVLSYLRLIVLPLNLNLDREYPLSTSLLQAPVLLSLALILGIWAAAWRSWQRGQDDARWSLMSCSVAWYFLTVAPSSSIAPLPDLMAEHRAYLPSIGALVALVCAADLLRSSPFAGRDFKDAMLVFMGTWAVLLIGATVARNYQWRSNVSLLRDTTMKSPNKFRGWSNLAAAYYDQKEFGPAIACLEKVIRLEPKRIPTYVDLGKACNAARLYSKGLEISRVGLLREPGNNDMLFNLAVSQLSLGQKKEAFEGFRQVTKSCPTNKQAHFGLGMTLADMGEFEKALEELRLSDALPPQDDRISSSIAEVEARARHQGGMAQSKAAK